MRIAILSDMHGDPVALEKVIEDLERVPPVDEMFIGGDLAQGRSYCRRHRPRN
jgi:3',5'-cyclic AMP phosphodiesterase CpdA